MIHHVVVDGTVWPVDVSTDDEDSAEWTLRYGAPEAIIRQRMSIASVLNAYKNVTSTPRTMKDATAMLRRARRAGLNGG